MAIIKSLVKKICKDTSRMAICQGVPQFAKTQELPVCCSVLQRDVVCCSVCCSVLQRDVVCCSNEDP